MASTLGPDTVRREPLARARDRSPVVPSAHRLARRSRRPPSGASAASPSGRRRRLWSPALVAAAPALAVCLVELANVGTVASPGADFALLARDADRALAGDLLLGPYSRFRWNHPGPALAYWQAPFWWASGQRYGGLGLGAAVLSAVTMASMVVAAARAAKQGAEARTAWVAAAVLVAFSFAYGAGRLREPWNPAAVILPLAALAVFGAAVAAGRRWWLPAWAVAASFCVQTHVGSVPVVGAIVVATWAIGTWRNRPEVGRFAGPGLVALALTAGLWALPIHQQLSNGDDGNLREIVDFFGDTPAPEHTWDDVREPLEVMAPLTVPRFGAAVGGETESPASAGVREQWILGLLGLGLVGGVVSGTVRRDRFRLTLATAGLVSVPAAIFAAFRVQGAIYPYLVFYAISVGLLAWLTVAFTVTAEVAAWRAPAGVHHRRPVPRHGLPPRARAGAPGWRTAFAVTGPVVVGLVALAVSVDAFTIEPSGEIRHDPVTAHLGADARYTLRAEGDVRRVVVDMHQQTWEVGTGVVRELEEHGYDVTIARSWTFLFGRDSRTDGDEQGRLVLAPAGPLRWPALPEDRVVTTHDGITLYYGEP